jgi:hypothetical protein
VAKPEKWKFGIFEVTFCTRQTVLEDDYTVRVSRGDFFHCGVEHDPWQ